jgi:hypothetical protein
MIPANLPTRKGKHGIEIETRPLYVEEWLETLPYIDFVKTCHLLQEALQATNKQDIKPSARLELIKLYNRPYQYYIDSQIKTGAQHTLQTIDAMRQQVHPLKQLAVHLGHGCKLAVDHALHKKTLWKHSKPPLQEMLMSLNYLSHALIFSYLEYAPTPKKVWGELNLIYSFAEGLGKHNTIQELPGYKDTRRTTIGHTYKRIIMASLADPYHLPFGAIWEIHEQLDTWAEYSQIREYHPVNNPTGYFVLDLNSDNKPIPFSKFDVSKSSEKHRLLDTTILENVIQKHVDLLKIGQPIDNSIVLSPFFAKSLMGHMLKAWGLPPKRYFPRQAKSGLLDLACGLKSVYFFCNDQNDFTRDPIVEEDDENVLITEEVDRVISQSHFSYSSEQWQIVDQGAGGYALINNGMPKNPVRVGELVGVRHPQGNWTMGVIRWLMVGKNKTHKIGIQNIAASAKPGAVRTSSGNAMDSEYRRAFIIGNNGDPDGLSIITEKDFYVTDRELDIEVDCKQIKVKAGNLLESSVGYEHFKCNPN